MTFCPTLQGAFCSSLFSHDRAVVWFFFFFLSKRINRPQDCLKEGWSQSGRRKCREGDSERDSDRKRPWRGGRRAVAWGPWGSSCPPLSRNPCPMGGETTQTWPRQGPFPSGPSGPDRKSSPRQGRRPGLHRRGLPRRGGAGEGGVLSPPGAARPVALRAHRSEGLP